MANEITLEQAKTLVKSGSLDGLGYNELAAVIRCLRINSVGDPDAVACLDSVTAIFLNPKKMADIAEGVSAEDYDAAGYIALNDGNPFPFDEHQSVHTVLNQKMAERFKDAVVKHQDLESMQDLSFSDLAEFGRLSNQFAITTPEDNIFVDNFYNTLDTKFGEVSEKKIIINPQDFNAIDYLLTLRSSSTETDNIKAKLDEAIQEYDDENNLEKADGKILEKNLSSMNAILDAIDIENPEVKNGILQDVFKVLNRVDITNDEGEVIPADSEERKEYITNMFEAAKLDVVQANLGNANFLMTPLREKTELTINGLKDSMFAMLGQCGVASTFRASTEEELVPDSDAQKKYQEESAKAAENALDNLINGDERFEVSGNVIIAGCVEKEVDFNNFQSRVNSIFPYSKASPQLKNRLNKVSGFFSEAWGNRHEIMKNIINNVKDNKQMHITNTLATLGVGLATASGFGGIAIGCYAAYTAASSTVWPVLAEANKARRMAKEKGEKVSFLSSLKAAWKSVKSQKSYKTKIVTSCIAGGIGAAIGFGGMSMGLETFMQKAVASVARSAGSVAAQTVGVIDAKREYKKNPTDENKAKLKSAKTSLAIGGSIAFLSSIVSVNRAVAANEVANGATPVTPAPKGNVAAAYRTSTPVDSLGTKTPVDSLGIKTPVDSLGTKTPVDSLGTKTPVDSLGTKTPVDSLGTKTPVDSLGTKTPVDSLGTKTPVDSLGTKTPVDSLDTKTPGNTAATGNAEVPANSGFNGEIPKYNKDMGISARQFQTILNTRSEEEVSRMYTNLNDDVMKKYFPGMTREQALYKYNRLDAWTARVKSDGNGNLVPLLGKDGNPVPRYQMNEEMIALKKIIECGEIADEKKLAAAVTAMDTHIDKNGDTDLSGQRTNNVITKLDNEGCGEDNHAYGRADGSAKTVEATTDTKTPNTKVPNTKVLDSKVLDEKPEDVLPKQEEVAASAPTEQAVDMNRTYLRIPGQYGSEIAIKGSFDAEGKPALSGVSEIDSKTIWLSEIDSKGRVDITRWNPAVQGNNGFIHTSADQVKATDIGVIIGAVDDAAKDGTVKLEGKIKLGVQNYADSTDVDVKKASLNSAVPSTMADELAGAQRVGADGSKKVVKDFFMNLINNSKSK